MAANEALDDDGLNEKQRQFCYYYFRNKNGTQAAIRAGYSPKSAYSMASELLKKPEIKALLQRMSDEVRNRITFDAAELVEYHMRVAFSDITDFVDFGSHKTPKVYNGHVVMMERPDTGAMVPVTRIVNEVTIKSSADVDGQLISEITESDSGVKIKLADRNKSLDFLERYFLVNPLDRHKIDYDAAQLKMQQEKHEHETKKYGGDIEDSDGLLSEFAQVIADVSGVKKDETDGDS
ncbi:MAG: terminase small subunit [Oscillospiraceae bacterium]|nr:terminase small subunit [Oscillospiraceae bacterium]